MRFLFLLKIYKNNIDNIYHVEYTIIVVNNINSVNIFNKGVILLKTLVLFSSKYGTTEKCVELLASNLKSNVEKVNVKKGTCKDIKEYDFVLIGGSIYAGTLDKDVKSFIEANEEALKNKRVGLFLCCNEKEKALNEYMKINFPEWLLEKAVVKEHLGHEIKLEEMNIFERGLLKYVMKVKESYSKIDNEAIARLAGNINRMESING